MALQVIQAGASAPSGVAQGATSVRIQGVLRPDAAQAVLRICRTDELPQAAGGVRRVDFFAMQAETNCDTRRGHHRPLIGIGGAAFSLAHPSQVNGFKNHKAGGVMAHDYVLGLAGGLLMGVACVGLFLFNGRILGVSGLLGGALSLSPDVGWRWAFIFGMVLAGGLTLVAYPQGFVIDIDRSAGATLLGGLLVGAGTQLGSGCTSGHGICGIGRLSVRSIVATLVFIAAGGIAVYVITHLFGGGV